MKIILGLVFLYSTLLAAQEVDRLKLNEIMKGKDFIGYWPENLAWQVDGNHILFDWNPENALSNSRYTYHLQSKKIQKINPQSFLESLEYDKSQKDFVDQYFVHDGNLWKYNKTNKKATELISSENQIFNVHRLTNPNKIAFQQDNNLYLYDATVGSMIQLTFFQKGKENKTNFGQNELSRQQLELFNYLQVEKAHNEYNKSQQNNPNNKKKIFLDKKRIDFLQLSKDGKFVYVGLGEYSENKNTVVEHFISDDGYTHEIGARPKVGENEPNHSFAIVDLNNDSLVFVNFDQLTNVRRKPSYLKEYGDSSDSYLENRKIIMHAPIQSKYGKTVMDIRSYDNKDRWIVEILPDTKSFHEIDNQHDEAWIGGPGISSWNMSNGVLGFYDSDKKIYFQSEKTGYSHLYSYDFSNKKIEQLTDGQFEIDDVQLSKNSTTFYLTCNKTHPGDRGFYKLDVSNKKLQEILSKSGAYETILSPDDKTLATLFSNKTNPWELYVAKNEPATVPFQITHSQREAYKKHPWTDPKIISFKGKDDVEVYARLYKAKETNNKPAVIFVHGAGYLQNAHNYWSQYYREFMFHHLLMDQGFTVLDIDYRASEGYGRDFRTAIYRHMGSLDLEDQVSGKKYLVDSLKINPNKIGIYGGSYGGFITLMALFTKPNEFACGAALRSVTDWMHYNHEYTSNILNYPTTDSLAYRRSSPIYFAENLTKPLLMLHGMVDDNVQFQDIVRLNQRLIELEKTNWELAVFPVEAHGFQYSYSWTDEYRRILELFNNYLTEK